MKERKQPAGNAALRRKAREKLRQQTDRLRELSTKDMKHLITELGTHQIELEMQNEELRRAQSELEASRGKYADLYDFAPVGYFTLNARGLILEANQTGASLLGIGKRLLINKPFSLFLAEEADRRAFRAHLEDVFSKLTRQTCEASLKKKKEPPFYAQLQSVAAEDREGKTGTVRVTVTDVTERKQAEKVLKSEEGYRALIEFSPEALAIHIGGRYVYANPAAARLFGAKDMKELLDKGVLDTAFPAQQQLAEESIHKIGEDIREPAWHEIKILRLDGQVREVETDAIKMPVQLVGQQPALVVFRDITNRKKAEEALKAAHAELKNRTYELDAVNRELEAFAFTISNDLKTPLRSIEGFTRAVLEDYGDKLDDTGRDYLTRVTSASKRMTQLIDAMLTMARLTGGELHEKTVDLSGMAQGISRTFQKQDLGRKVKFIIAEKVKVNGDQEMLYVMLENLMANSWKFTSRHDTATIEFGTINCGLPPIKTFEGRLHADCGMKNRKSDSKSEIRNPKSKIVYFVRDDGAGFDMKYADKLFKPFQRMHNNDEFPGLGIGLAIANRIILRHNGRLWAESAPEKGATFYFTL